jgi:hypothetical protein
MYSYGHFRPGGKKGASCLIEKVAEYNKIYGPEGKTKAYSCITDNYDKNNPGSGASYANKSYATQIAQIISARKGGNIQFGNFYLGQPLNINYLGRIEGMPGGSGMPPINRF